MLTHTHFYPFVPFLLQTFGHSQFDILPLAGDASARKYFRIVLPDSISFVLMVWDPFIDNNDYPFLSVLNHFNKHGVHVPSVVAKAPAQGLILLDDLGDLTLERKFWETQNQELVLPFYHDAIDQILKVHFPATADRSNCTAFRVDFDVARLHWEMEYGKKHYLLDLLQLKPTSIEMNMLDRVFMDMCEKLNAVPKRIVHRDFHSRNVMIKLNKLYLIDFQDARMGPVQYDLVSLLKDSYVSLSDKLQDTLIEYYLQESKPLLQPSEAKDFSNDGFREVFELQTLQRCFKACGSFASFKILRNDNRYLKYLGHTIQHVRRSLDHFTDYKDFAKFIDNNGLCERMFDAS